MLESYVLLENSGDGGGSATVAALNLKNDEGDCDCGPASDEFRDEDRVKGEVGDRNSAGIRWPSEETLALLKIRSDMDVAFRDSAVKAPLWDEVSRKLAELGYHRNAKKCKEKFENIYKYHKRTKECGRQNGKNYRFFEQLELLDNKSSFPWPLPNQINQTCTTGVAKAIPIPMQVGMAPTISVSQDDVTLPCLTRNSNFEFMSTSTSTTSSSEKEYEGSVKKKSKLEDYFRRLLKEVLEKQETLQNKFIEAIEKCENERIAREEQWKMQEMARLRKQQEIIAQERAINAAKDAALIAFLQKVSEQPTSLQIPETHTPNPTPSEKIIDKQELKIAENPIQGCSSRWPKAEVEDLIMLRTNLELQYQDNGPKGPLWEEISSAMKRLGYDRSAKRCKEKWENMNKYFKRVKTSNKKRPEDSKTCLYFDLLESVRERKSKKVDSSDSSSCNLKPEDILMQMIGHQQESVTEFCEKENADQNLEDGGEEDDDDNGDDYQIVANPSSMAAME